jgi:hypothetical protein
MNHRIGKPRKWVCYNHSLTDGILEDAEILFHYYWESRKMGFYCCYDAIPLELLRNLITSCEQRLRGLTSSLERRSEIALTEAEKRYCEMEGINPAEFLMSKGAK